MYRPYSSPIGSFGSSMDVESTIRGLTQDFCMNFNTGNYDQVGGLFASDGSFMAPHHESAVGPKAIERKLREFGEAGYQDLRVDTTRVDYSGDMAMEVGRYSLSMVKENGAKVADRGKYLKVWRRLGAWRIVADCWSSNLPASATQISEEKSPVAGKITMISDDVPRSA
ncbi:MAG TPA: nuclear transport factor 2 family protein [Terriglobales bacterium]|nr:nuclear transport factor 2 family protein [Terriglobales bacterium]